MLLIHDVNLSPLLSQDCHFLFMHVLWIALIVVTIRLWSPHLRIEKKCEYWMVAHVTTLQCSL